jgi:hypothetical protein
MRTKMIKYRVSCLQTREGEVFYIKKRFLLFFWVCDDDGFYKDIFITYKSVEEAIDSCKILNKYK